MTTLTNAGIAGKTTAWQQLLNLCRDPRHHCAVVLAVNAGLAACAASEPFALTLLLHLALLPVNAWRLLRACRFVVPAARRGGVQALQRHAEAIRFASNARRDADQTVRLARPAPGGAMQRQA